MNVARLPIQPPLALAVLSLGWLTSCSPASVAAITLDEASSAPTIVLALCEGESVSSVTMRTIGDDDVELPAIWRIEAAEPSVNERYVAGVVPKGFVQTTPLARARMTGELELYAVTQGGAAAGHYGIFRMDDLKPGLLLDGGHEPISQQEFEDSAAEVCAGLRTLLSTPVAWALLTLVLGGGLFALWSQVRSSRRVRILRRSGVIR